MGNRPNGPNCPQKNKKSNAKIQSILKMKSNLFKSKKPTPQDKFIIDFSHKYHCKLSQITDITSLDQRRIVFVSLIGLYQTYKQCPPHILYSAIFILPLKREWIYNIDKYIYENDPEFPLNKLAKLTIFNSETETEFADFVHLLQWKDKSGLLFFMLDEYTHTKTLLVKPFWMFMSNKLSKLYNTINEHKYNPLYLDDQWWENTYEKNKYMSKYNIDATDILSELYFMTMKFNTIKEIIYQSNPKSLNPVSFYGENNDRFKRYSNEFVCDCDSDSDSDIDGIDDKEGSWYISTDYDIEKNQK